MRKILTVISVVIMVLVFTVVFNALINAIRIDLPSLENSAKRLLGKTEAILKKSKTFDEKKALQGLGMNAINGFYYRFDEHVEEAICEDNKYAQGKAQAPQESFGIEFDGNDFVTLLPSRGK